MHGRKRREIKNLVRQARDRAQAPAPSPAHEAACMCGGLLRVTEAQENQRQACENCGRPFVVNFIVDAETGKKSLTPVYLENRGNVESTVTAERQRKTRAAEAEEAEESKGVLDDDLMPPPPEQIRFSCPCGKPILARREQYDSRVRCPHCGARLVTTLVYNAVGGTYAIEALRLSDPPSGETRRIDLR